MSDIKKIVITAMLISLGIVLPMVFHMIPQGLGGRIMLPMHIPVLLAGLIVGPFFGFFAGLLTPLLSSMTTGMPVAGITAYRMMAELAAYGLVAGLVTRFVRTGRRLPDLYIALVAAMVAGRVVSAVVQAFLLFGGGDAFRLWVRGSFYTSIPGIVLQLILVPAIVLALERGKLIK